MKNDELIEIIESRQDTEDLTFDRVIDFVRKSFMITEFEVKEKLWEMIFDGDLILTDERRLRKGDGSPPSMFY